MSTTEADNDESGTASSENVDVKLEVVVIPVSDVDRAKEFYGQLGWRLDADFPFDNGFRVVQFTPPGSACSVQFGTRITSATPGSAQGLYLVVSDIEAARKSLLARGVDVSEAFHHEGDVHTGTDEPYLFGRRRVSGVDPELNVVLVPHAEEAPSSATSPANSSTLICCSAERGKVSVIFAPTGNDLTLRAESTSTRSDALPSF